MTILHREVGRETRSLFLGQGLVLFSIADDMCSKHLCGNFLQIITMLDRSRIEVFLHSDLTDCQTEAISSSTIVTADPKVKDDLRKANFVQKSACPLLDRNEMLFGERLPNQRKLLLPYQGSPSVLL